MSEQVSLSEALTVLNDTVKKNYAMTELLMQTFSAFIISTGNKDNVEKFIKSTSSSADLTEAHEHAQGVFLKILDSVAIIPEINKQH
jgi:hypothetical protein